MAREYIQPNEDKDLISLTDLAKKLDVDKSTIQYWVRKKGFPKPKGYMWLYGAFYLKDEGTYTINVVHGNEVDLGTKTVTISYE